MKSNAILWTVVGVLAIATALIIGYAFWSTRIADPVPPSNGSGSDGSPVACTLEAKLCPDGSYVGRIPPDCEFAPCPGEF